MSKTKIQLQADIKGLHEKLASALIANDSYELEVKKLNIQLGKATGRVEKLTIDIISYNDKLKTAVDLLAGNTEFILVEQAENKSIKEKLTEATSELETYKGHAEIMTRQNQELSSVFNANIVELETERDKLKDDVVILTTDLESMTEERDNVMNLNCHHCKTFTAELGKIIKENEHLTWLVDHEKGKKAESHLAWLLLDRPLVGIVTDKPSEEQLKRNKETGEYLEKCNFDTRVYLSNPACTFSTSELQTDNKNLRADLENLKKLWREQAVRIAEINNLCDFKTERIVELEVCLAAANKVIEMFEANRNNMIDDDEKLGIDLTLLKMDNGDWEKKALAKDKWIAKLTDKLKVAKSDAESWIDKLKACNSDLSNTQIQRDRLLVDLGKLRLDYDCMKLKDEGYEAELIELERLNGIDRINSIYASRIRIKEQSIANWRERVLKAEGDVKQIEEANNMIQVNIDIYDDMVNDLKMYQEVNRNLDKANKELIERSDINRDQINELNKQVANLSEDLDIRDKLIAEGEVKYNKCRYDLGTYTLMATEAIRVAEADKINIDSLTRQLRKAREEKEAGFKVWINKALKIDVLEMDIAINNKVIDGLQKELNETREREASGLAVNQRIVDLGNRLKMEKEFTKGYKELYELQKQKVKELTK